MSVFTFFCMFYVGNGKTAMVPAPANMATIRFATHTRSFWHTDSDAFKKAQCLLALKL